MHNFCRNNENYTPLCSFCLYTYGDQTKLEERVLRYIEQEVRNTSQTPPNLKIKLKNCFMKVDPPNWTAADFE